MRVAEASGENYGMASAQTEFQVADLDTDSEHFLLLLLQAEEGVTDVLPEMRRLAAESDSVLALLLFADNVATRYAIVEDTL